MSFEYHRLFCDEALAVKEPTIYVHPGGGRILTLPPVLFPSRHPLPRSSAEVLTADIADDADGNTRWQSRHSLLDFADPAFLTVNPLPLQPSTGGPPAPPGVGVYRDSFHGLIP